MRPLNVLTKKMEKYNGRKIPVEEVLSRMTSDVPKYKSEIFDGAEVNIGILNLKVFHAKGVGCTGPCGCNGQFFRIERSGTKGSSIYNDWHLNLYTIDQRGQEVMMTKDHIRPKSKGGSDEVENLQPMCEICNRKKGSKHMDEFMKTSTFHSVDTEQLNRHFEKTKQRMMERYSTIIDMSDYRKMVLLAENGRVVQHLGSNNVKAIFFKDKEIKVLASPQFIISALDPKPDEHYYRMPPSFCKHEAERGLLIYDEILATAHSEMRLFDTAKDQALYFTEQCSYPPIMFAIWKKYPAAKLNRVVWDQVKKKFEELQVA